MLFDMKEWLCVQVFAHKKVAKTIQEQQEKGWTLFTYQVSTVDNNVIHYMLFERNSMDNELAF